MLYSERLPYKSQTTLQVSLSDFSKGINTTKHHSVLPLNYAVNTYNFDYNSGALTKGLGLSYLTTPYQVFGRTYYKGYSLPNGVSRAKNVWHYRRYDYDGNSMSPLLVIYGDDGNFYCTGIRSDVGFSAIVNDNPLVGEPVGINYRLNKKDCMIFCSTSADDNIYTWDSINYMTKTSGCPAVLSLAVHAGRLFATSTGDKKKLFFSDDMDPRNWTIGSDAGGYIEISDERGMLNKLIEWNNYLYIIRDYGITRVSAWGDQTDFVVRHLYMSTSRIYSNTAVHCGGCMMMLCQDGLYRFDGADTQKVNLGLDKFFDGVDNSNAVGAYLDGKYYLACRLNFGDNVVVGCEDREYTNNVLLEYDLNTGLLRLLRGVDITLLENFQTDTFSRLVCGVNLSSTTNVLAQVDYSGQVFGVGTSKYWQSPFTDLGYPDKTKVLRYVTVKSVTDANMKVITDQKTYNIPLRGNSVSQKYMLDIKCKEFCIAFGANDADADISAPSLVATVV